MAILIADSGSTKCEWCVVSPRKKSSYFTQGMSPYFLTPEQMAGVVRNELLPQLKKLNWKLFTFMELEPRTRTMQKKLKKYCNRFLKRPR